MDEKLIVFPDTLEPGITAYTEEAVAGRPVSGRAMRGLSHIALFCQGRFYPDSPAPKMTSGEPVKLMSKDEFLECCKSMMPQKMGEAAQPPVAAFDWTSFAMTALTILLEYLKNR